MPTPTPFFILKRKTQRPYVWFTMRAIETPPETQLAAVPGVLVGADPKRAVL